MDELKSDSIIKLFDAFRSENIECILLRNIASELPYGLKKNKDIDVLVSDGSGEAAEVVLSSMNFKLVRHPHRFDKRLYNLPKFRFYKNPHGVYLDVSRKLCCRSLDAGQWIPLDESIQTRAWEARRTVQYGALTCDMLSPEVEFVSLLCRCVFDKRTFPPAYVSRIFELYKVVNKEELLGLLQLVFFKFSPRLIEFIDQKKTESIICSYFQFREY